MRLAKELAQDSVNQAPGLALATSLYWESGEKEAAVGTFKKLRAISARFDLDTPIFSRLAPVAKSLELAADWRVAAAKRKDAGKRPDLDSLGPFRWTPYTAPEIKLTDDQNNEFSMAECRGRPVLLVFYLGRGCSHCLEQLGLLSDSAKAFEKQGIRIVAISTDSGKSVAKSDDTKKAGPESSFPILSDKSLRAFKAYRAYDDFEQMPLHGTFLVDGAGKVRWQDISFDPFTDVKFLLSESQRLLKL
jgi:peroxiredoxin